MRAESCRSWVEEGLDWWRVPGRDESEGWTGRGERTEALVGPTVRSASVERAKPAGVDGGGTPVPLRWAVVLTLVAFGVAFRFVAPSPLWLDEAISASLADEASQGWSNLIDALRHDGHPPLYYVLLAVWAEVVGDGDRALRAFSGVLGVATMALAWPVARRHLDRWGAMLTLGVVATNPFAIRYATEVRMYELLLVLLLVGHLAVVRAWERPTSLRLATLSVVVAGLTLTHYWALFAVTTSAVALVAAASPWGRRVGIDTRRAWRLLAAVGVGCLAFVPWLPVFLDQASHTGTPWSPAPRPTVVAALALEAFGGGRGSEALLVVVVLSVLVTLGIATRVDGGRGAPVLRLAGERWLQVLVGFGLGTLLVGAAASLITGTAFQGRYAVFALMPVLMAATVGLSRLPARVGLAGLVTLALLSGVSLARELDRGRTQVGEVADAVIAGGSSGDLVVFCPDQLAPVGHRLLADSFTTLAYPALDDGRRVDWRDYAKRNAAVDVEAVADDVAIRSTGLANVWLAWMDGYETFGHQCPDLRLALADRLGRPIKVVYADADRFDDAANLSRFRLEP